MFREETQARKDIYGFPHRFSNVPRGEDGDRRIVGCNDEDLSTMREDPGGERRHGLFHCDFRRIPRRSRKPETSAFADIDLGYFEAAKSRHRNHVPPAGCV